MKNGFKFASLALLILLVGFSLYVFAGSEVVTVKSDDGCVETVTPLFTVFDDGNVSSISCSGFDIVNSSAVRCKDDGVVYNTHDDTSKLTLSNPLVVNLTGFLVKRETSSFKSLNCGEKVDNIKHNVTVDNGEVSVYECDAGKFGSCSYDPITETFECDSKIDGNADGVCDSGETCKFISVNGGNFKEVHSGMGELRDDKYKVECILQ